MKRNNDFFGRGGFLRFPGLSRLRPGPALASLAAFAVCVLVILSGVGPKKRLAGELREFEVGKVAERDVSAEQTVSYIDENATRLRLEAQERLVPAVFRYTSGLDGDIREAYGRFVSVSLGLFESDVSADAYRYALQAEYPGAFAAETLDTLFLSPARTRLLEYGSDVLDFLLTQGIFAVPQVGLEQFNPDFLELLHASGGRIERERVPYKDIISIGNVKDHINEYIASGSFPSSFAAIAADLLRPFLTETVFFSAEDTNLRLTEVKARLEPVVKQISRGDRVIRKGFIVTEDDLIRLRALNMSSSASRPSRIIGELFLLFLVFALFLFLMGPRFIGRVLTNAEVYLLCILAVLYIIGAVFLSGVDLGIESMPASVLIPTALVVMLPSILIGSRAAAAMSMVLPLAALLSGSFDTASYVFALASGIAASYSLQGVERRMDLVKAGFIISAVNCITAGAILMIQQSSLGDYMPVFFWSAFNGLGSGMLVLGILPLLEHALNTATIFRLIELSDLNSPILKRLLTTAPGTYSHSVMVANLAESACQEIGANAILARVGSYYHDIGKMEQPDYFIENQTVYNKHEDIAPRLSATVIRSHVKIGVEKARNMALPKEVIEIIAEHHGNSVISWFYNEALKRESQVNVEDFTYPGSPPRSRESAVVMLADVVEAAVRTLKKPSVSRLEKFIQELIMSKFEQNQLSESELTFRDLETIRKAFVRVLAGHYHSRIEYPKALKESPSSQGGQG
ncbi:HDIG domain-containing protein [Treponema sp. OttesenSCG-928-L16]|nr:HDIG domain-containing protein [Treponema sp. OttesenSCG-928-L16]